MNKFVPVVDSDNKPLMPTTQWRAARWIKSGKVTPFWKKGIFCVRLNQEPSSRIKQEIAVGVDPGSKKEGFTVKSKNHTFLNIQSDAVTWVKKYMEDRKSMRSSRRGRKCPCRKPRWNRSIYRKLGKIPPSTKARWQWKLNVLLWLKKIYPITYVIVEDVKAYTKKGKKSWNIDFNCVEQGKNWFYQKIEELFEIILKQGYETKELREKLNLKKSKDKMSNYWSAHCVDSWVLANSVVGGNFVDNKQIIYVIPIQLHRRKLHKFCPSKGDVRKNYGGTISLGFKRGSLVKHSKYGIAYVGGSSKGKITLHSLKSGKRLSRNIKPQDCKFLSYSSRRYFY